MLSPFLLFALWLSSLLSRPALNTSAVPITPFSSAEQSTYLASPAKSAKLRISNNLSSALELRNESRARECWDLGDLDGAAHYFGLAENELGAGGGILSDLLLEEDSVCQKRWSQARAAALRIEALRVKTSDGLWWIVSDCELGEGDEAAALWANEPEAKTPGDFQGFLPTDSSSSLHDIEASAWYLLVVTKGGVHSLNARINWLLRAHELAPANAMIAFTAGSLLLNDLRRPTDALPLLEQAVSGFRDMKSDGAIKNLKRASRYLSDCTEAIKGSF